MTNIITAQLAIVESTDSDWVDHFAATLNVAGELLLDKTYASARSARRAAQRIIDRIIRDSDAVDGIITIETLTS
jgi:hypothetical protein